MANNTFQLIFIGRDKNVVNVHNYKKSLKPYYKNIFICIHVQENKFF